MSSFERHPSLDDRFDPATRVVEHDPAWTVRAQAELARIGAALGSVAVRLEHVGSTAVPGLAAKPIIDLQLSVEAIGQDAPFRGCLERLGYLFVADPDSPAYRFFAKPAQRPRSFHLHVCEAGSTHEIRHPALRDYLSSHREEAESYAAVKRELVGRTGCDRLAYIDGKARYVDALELRALAWSRTNAG